MAKRTDDPMDGLKKYLIGVAVSLTIVLATQTGVLVWWCGEINTRVEYLDRDVAKNDKRLARLESRTPLRHRSDPALPISE